MALNTMKWKKLPFFQAGGTYVMSPSLIIVIGLLFHVHQGRTNHLIVFVYWKNCVMCIGTNVPANMHVCM
jgi:hypothetical protein